MQLRTLSLALLIGGSNSFNFLSHRTTPASTQIPRSLSNISVDYVKLVP